MPLVTREDAFARKRKVKEITVENKKATKAARASSWSCAVNNLLIINNLIDSEGFDDNIEYETRPNIHDSHDIKRVGTQDAIYCARCSTWSSGKSLSHFALPCIGTIPTSSAFQLRLLQCGVVPTAGARIPLHCKKKQKFK